LIGTMACAMPGNAIQATARLPENLPGTR